MSDVAKNAEEGHPIDRTETTEGYRLRIVPILLTLVVVAAACGLTYAMWQSYVGAPWTRDGSVRVYVVTLAPEVSGQVVALPITDNQLVHKGDLLMTIDKRDYDIAVKLADANVAQAKADYENKQVEAKRRAQLTDLATTPEERESYAATSQIAYAVYQQALANLDKAKLNLERTEVHATVNGWITNLATQLGDYAATGQRALSLVDADSFWVDGYFEETKIAPIREGDPAKIWLLGYKQVLAGHVESLGARHRGRECAGGREWLGQCQSGVHLGAACPARARPHPHRSGSARRAVGGGDDGHCRGRSATSGVWNVGSDEPLMFSCFGKGSVRPSLRAAGEATQNQSPGLLRRFAPRNDGRRAGAMCELGSRTMAKKTNG